MADRHDRWFRRLLRLLPDDFRREFGDQMTADFADERADAARAGRTGTPRLWLRTIGGIARTGPREHLAQCAQDARHGLRLARRHPVSTAAAALVLALGITVLTSSFAVVDAFMWRPLPFGQPDALVHVWSTDRPARQSTLRSSLAAFELWSTAQSLDGLAAFNYTGAELTGGSEPERIDIGRVSANAFDVLGVAPLAGRAFRPGEDRAGAEPVVILSHGFWQSRYGGAPDVIGRAIRIDDVPRTIVGVMPESFVFPLPLTKLWMPYAFAGDAYPRDRQTLQLVARLAPGAARERAEAELSAMREADARAHGEEVRGGARLQDLRGALNFADEGFQIAGPVLLMAGALILLAACANVSSVLLGRVLARAREVSVRSAIGASRFRLFRQFVLESTGLLVAAAGLGLVLTSLWLNQVSALLPLELYRVGAIAIDARAAAVAIVAAALAVLLAAWLPARRFGRVDPATVLKSEGTSSTGSKGARRTQHALLAVQVALSVALVATSFVAIRVVRDLADRPTGFEREGVLTSLFVLNDRRYETADDVRGFHQRVLEQLSAAPGVRAAATVDHLPLNHETNSMIVSVPGDGAASDADRPTALHVAVSDRYFETLGIPVREGRAFDSRDSGGPRAVIVNEALAARLWPGASPLGRTLALDGSAPLTVVGTVGNARHADLAGDAEPMVYRSLRQVPVRYARVLVRVDEPLGMVGTMRAAFGRVDPNLPLVEIRTLDEVVRTFLLPQRAMGISMSAMGLVGLLLTTIGLFGLLDVLVGERRKEIGLRRALGADAGSVVVSVVRRVVVVTAAGLVGGLALAAAMTQALAGVLPGARALDPVAIAGTCGVVMLVVAIAAFLPARRAVKVDPLTALRSN